MTPTGRMLAHGERVGGYQSLGDLDDIPGFAAGLLDQLKARPRL